ncbi:MAG: PilN domain-containing protein [Stagnimonas sp.]|nr:PilN domain-containing protein [Stagnimonas sp.]
MTKINLLDWRAARREKRRQEFLTRMGLGVVAALSILVLAWMSMNNAITGQQQRNEYLVQQIAETDQKIKEIEELEKVKENLLARMRVIERLQASRSATVHFFDELVNTLPDGILLTLIKQTGDNVQIDGIAESNGRISSYIKNLEASPWFNNPRLVVIKTSEKNRQREGQFTLQVQNLTKQSKEDQEKAKAAAGGKS